MKKFKYRLDSVLKVRELHKKLAERELAVTQSNLNKNQSDIQNNESAYQESFAFLNSRGDNVQFWNEITFRYQSGLKQQRAQLEERKDELAKQLEVDKTKLANKVKEEMVIEKLKEYQRQEHLREAAREEQLEIEEIDLLKRGLNGKKK